MTSILHKWTNNPQEPDNKQQKKHQANEAIHKKNTTSNPQTPRMGISSVFFAMELGTTSNYGSESLGIFHRGRDVSMHRFASTWNRLERYPFSFRWFWRGGTCSSKDGICIRYLEGNCVIVCWFMKQWSKGVKWRPKGVYNLIDSRCWWGSGFWYRDLCKAFTYTQNVCVVYEINGGRNQNMSWAFVG